MNHAPNCSSQAPASTCSEDDATGLPALATWRAVYAFVAIVFVVYVALLCVLQRVFA